MATKTTKQVPAKHEPQKNAVSTAVKKVGRGFEEADASAYSIPFLIILQSNSPQLDTIKGAKPGMILNTATGALLTKAEVIPCVYQRRFLRWGPRDAGGGFKGSLLPSDADKLRNEGDVVDSDGRVYFPLPDGTVNPKKCDLLSDTRNHYVLVRTKEGVKPAVMSMASSQVKVSRNWMTKMQNAGGDMWANAYEVSTTKVSNDKGSWYVWLMGDATDAKKEEQEIAEAFYQSVATGMAQARFDKDGESVRE
jgi:hypothetical protein